MVVEQGKPVQVLPQDTALCLMNRKILENGDDDKETPTRKQMAGSGWGDHGGALSRESLRKRRDRQEGQCLQWGRELVFLSKSLMQGMRKSGSGDRRSPPPQSRSKLREKAGRD